MTLIPIEETPLSQGIKTQKLFEEFLIQNKLTPVNSLSFCKGIITRIRLLVTGRIESSTIDFNVVCESVLAFVSEMIIDSDKKYIATNFTNVKKEAMQ